MHEEDDNDVDEEKVDIGTYEDATDIVTTDVENALLPWTHERAYNSRVVSVHARRARPILHVSIKGNSCTLMQYVTSDVVDVSLWLSELNNFEFLTTRVS